MKSTICTALLAACALSFSGCDSSSRSHTAADTVGRVDTLRTVACVEQPGFKRYFDEAGVHGTVVLYNPHDNRMECYNSARADSGFIPASTFKIFNSLVALETGAITSESDTLEWDGTQRPIAGWNKSQDMREAIQQSTVWFYQELARRAGRERMQHYINTVGYGNRDISGPIDRFWLDGQFRVSAREQIALLERLYTNNLPFSQRSMDIVKDIMVNERTDSTVLRAKTGWGIRLDDQIGWWVGYVEKGDNVWFFALNIGMKGEEDIPKRKTIVRRILADKGVLPLH